MRITGGVVIYLYACVSLLVPDHSVHPWGLTGSQFLEGPAGKKGVTFFRGLQFLHKNKVKVEIFKNKKNL